MKKIFTLIAAAVVAATSFAQNTVSFAEDTKINSGETLSSGSLSVTFGAANDAQGNTWKITANKAGFEEAYPYYVQGSQNVKDANGKGYKEAKKNIPTSGCFYILKSSEAGTLTTYMKAGKEKPLYVTDKEGAALEASALSLVDEDGNAGEWTTDGSNQRIINKTDADFIGTMSFKAEANKEYYVFGVGSKLTVFAFTLSKNTGISTVETEAAEAADAPAYNLAGQKVDDNYNGVIVKNGKKYLK